MPVIDGFECTKKIREKEINENPPKHIPIIALTADVMYGTREACLRVGMYISYFFKKNLKK